MMDTPLFPASPSRASSAPKRLGSLDENQVRLAIRSSLLIAAVFFSISIITIVTSLLAGNSLADPANFAAMIIPALGGILVLISGWRCWRTHNPFGVYLLIGSFLVVILAQSIITSGYGILLGVAAMIVPLAIATQTLPDKQSLVVIAISAITASAVILIDLVGPSTSLYRGISLSVFAAIANGLLVFYHAMMIVRRFPDYSLRAKLILSFVSVSLVVISILAAIFIFTSRRSLIASTNRTLRTAALLTANKIDVYFTNTSFSLQSEAKLATFNQYLKLPTDQRSGGSEEQNTLVLLQYLCTSANAVSYALLDPNQQLLLEYESPGAPQFARLSLPAEEEEQGNFEATLAARKVYISPLVFLSTNYAYLYLSTRIDDDNDQLIGILIARYPASVLQDLITQSNNLAGDRSYAILMDENHLRMAQGFASHEVLFTTFVPLGEEKIGLLQNYGRLPHVPIFLLSTGNQDFEEGVVNFSDARPYFTAHEANTGNLTDSVSMAKTSIRSWLVAFVQPQNVALAAAESQTRATVITAILTAIFTSLVASLVALMFTNPISRMITTAQKITAGDLSAQVEIRSRDEIGVLGQEFNSMTQQLRQNLQNLENRVTERTAELEKASAQLQYRASQFQAVAESAHAIASLQNPDELLHNITELISQRFNFYHVGIFMLDNTKEYAILQAANSEGGQHMLARGHQLKVGQTGIVGYVAGRGEPRIALDVGQDAVFFDNPDLPLTRSEAALPLHIGEQILGVLDVQSTQPTAFTNEDLTLLTTLADQVSIAIENARLFTETRQALTEVQTAQSQYLLQAWERVVVEQPQSGFVYDFGKLKPLDIKAWKSPDGGQPQVITPSQEMNGVETPTAPVLAVPIMLRGQAIGVFNFEEIAPDHTWSEEEIGMIKAVADQVGLALENARLLEATQHRAERDHRIQEITDKMRRAVDMDSLIQTAVREMAAALGVPEAYVQFGPPPKH
jgi:GAF domain-containing protein/HAMP domain-containing protein